MKVYLSGNLLVNADSMPLKLLPKLKRTFPEIEFIEIDPNEDFIPEDDSVIIDTVVGIEQVALFTDIERFADHKLISPHDYDLGFHLKLLKKTGKLNRVKIIGIPTSFSISKGQRELTKLLRIISN